MYTIHKWMILISILVLFVGCNNQVTETKVSHLKSVAQNIDKDFKSLVPDIDETVEVLQKLYLKESQEKVLKTIDKSQYQMHSSGVFYRPKFENTSAVFVSGFVPVNERIKDIVYFTEPIDEFFQKKVAQKKEIAQIYYNDKYSYNRIYPGFDVISQYAAKMNIPDYNFYYLADAKHNPSKKHVWVNEPYVDPAGRGWMVSLIKPVYVNGELEGVPGIDITIDKIFEKYINDSDAEISIFSNQGVAVALTERMASILSMPVLKEHKYIDTIQSDTFRQEDYSLFKSKDENVKKLSNDIIKNQMEQSTLQQGDDEYEVYSIPIKELNWYAVMAIKKE